mmetsp:Transcript_8950/g.24861  ORF Transcript_8950/g.24861 Transcript_8950/m.24861 type:complete len:438 (-) Transcript_8950:78-1391(-)
MPKGTPREYSALARSPAQQHLLLEAMQSQGEEGEQHGEEEDEHGFQTQFPPKNAPRPPDDLWDTKDAQRLELVKCDAFVRLSAIDPKQGTFRVRMKCLWAFRTLNSHEEAEMHLRGVPGIRMPGLIEVVEESRVWKDLTFDSSSKTTDTTVFWRGISLFTMDGFKAFQMHQFPYDRHILNLERLEFVWRSDKDSADYYKSMKVVSLMVTTSSMLPEWTVFPAYVYDLNTEQPDFRIEHSPSQSGQSGTPTYASKFTVRLRIERKYQFYAWQVFLVTYLISIVSCTPLAMHPDAIGDRLAVYIGGMLTLVSFKYSISDHLPSVPYQTFTDKFLLAQIITVFGCSILAIVTFRIVDEFEKLKVPLDWSENILGCLIAAGWTTALVWASFVKPLPRWRDAWKDVMSRDRKDQDAFGKEEGETRLKTTHGLQGGLQRRCCM